MSSGTVTAVAVAGRTFPVKRLYLGDAVEMSGYQCSTGRSSDFARPDVTEAVLRKLEGSGATPEDRGLPAAGAGSAPDVDADVPMTLGQKMIAENLAARSAKEARIKESTATGAGTIGGLSQAWIDRVGRNGMRSFDPALRGFSDRTLDTLRTVDHSLNPVGIYPPPPRLHFRPWTE